MARWSAAGALLAVVLASLGLVSCGGDSCPESIEAYCASIGGCPMTWAAAQDPKSWKGPCATGVVLSSCANVRTAVMPNFDVGIVFEYDAATGALFRVESVGAKDVCYGGSGSLETCDDPHPTQIQCTPP